MGDSIFEAVKKRLRASEKVEALEQRTKATINRAVSSLEDSLEKKPMGLPPKRDEGKVSSGTLMARLAEADVMADEEAALRQFPEFPGKTVDAEDEDIFPEPPRRCDKVVIVGWSGNRWKAPFDRRDEYEMWGFNDPPGTQILKYDRWFQLHTRQYLDQEYQPHWNNALEFWQDQTRMPFYMFERQWDIYTSIAFPVQRIEDELPHGWYHAGSFDWLVAFAILMGFSEIRLDGLGYLQFGGEPFSARGCLEYWLGVAEGRGIKTVVPEDTDVRAIFQYLKSKRQYGIDESKPVQKI